MYFNINLLLHVSRNHHPQEASTNFVKTTAIKGFYYNHIYEMCRF